MRSVDQFLKDENKSPDEYYEVLCLAQEVRNLYQRLYDKDHPVLRDTEKFMKRCWWQSLNETRKK